MKKVTLKMDLALPEFILLYKLPQFCIEVLLECKTGAWGILHWIFIFSLFILLLEMAAQDLIYHVELEKGAYMKDAADLARK